MAVFLINICKFNGCGITFPSLGDLIQHIEDTHIDYDPKVVEQKEQAQPACLPLSYVLRFISDAARKESPFLGSSGVELKRKLAIKHHSYSLSSSNRSNTPTGSELDEDEMIVSESEDSNDSWTTEEFSSEFIMRYGSRHSGSSNGTPGNEKPFACPVPGCKKRYKNVNGIKYHSKNGHKKDGKVRKGYKCHCNKKYKTAQGLKSHALVAHNTSPDNVSNVIVRSTSPSQSLGSLSPSSISNMSSSNGSCNNINQSTNGNCITQAPPPPSLQQQQQQSQQQTPQVNHLTNGGSIQQQQQQQQQHTSITTTNSINQSVAGSTVAAANHLMRGNIGLISIKSSSKPNTTNLIAANVTASKILKLAAASAAASGNEGTTAILENESPLPHGSVIHSKTNATPFATESIGSEQCEQPLSC
ncbi:mediator of RNA polymerase II transcription subunit 13 [Eupeodes corollae]|uniref:mediator of RNA polymerase II transcription subunit 13 n=1 Tax=Eupeodes corollae TaxID=290404 RepID=UPI00249376B7|nr:mediator of RNA polymerase II transcription subunit 13 [Eupeodes corollae]